jgi:hypothetical protein
LRQHAANADRRDQRDQSEAETAEQIHSGILHGRSKPSCFGWRVPVIGEGVYHSNTPARRSSHDR